MTNRAPAVPTRSRPARAAPVRELVVALLALVAAAPGLRAQDADAEGLDYAIRPGDQIRIVVFTAAGEELPQVAGERLVDQRGRLFLPLIGTLNVEGLNADQIREVLRERFGDFYDDPVVDVTVRLKINVTGAVRSSGHYFVDPSSTVVDALALAGGAGTGVGFTNTAVAADPSEIRVIRGDEQIVLDLRPEHADEEAVEFHIQSGDWIYVPPRARSRIRDNLNFASSILTVVASTVGLVLLFTR